MSLPTIVGLRTREAADMQRYRHARRQHAGTMTFVPRFLFGLTVGAVSAFLMIAVLIAFGVLSLPA